MRLAAAFHRARPGLGSPRPSRGPVRLGTLAAFAVLAFLLLSPGWSSAAGVCDTPVANPIACENSKPGTPAEEWDVPDDENPTIDGFATEMSVDQGDTLRFKIKTNAADYRVDIYRLGYYGGDGARRVATVTPSVSLPQTQPPCVTETATGLFDCGNWAVSASWNVPSDAVSGVYLARPVRLDNGKAEHILFVVRDDDGHSDVLFQTADTTWQAYNNYGGKGLYARGAVPRAYKVSYNRPLRTRFNGEGRSNFFSAEYAMVRWLERNAYKVSYTSGIDSDRRGAELLEHRLFLSVGHDEYWSGAQRANVEAARDAGVNLGFFSGNEIFWKHRWEPSIDGTSTPHRTLVSYKETHDDAKIDPSPIWTGTWRDPRFSPPSDGGRPENALTGTFFQVNGFRDDPMYVPAEYGALRIWRNTDIATLQPGQRATFPTGTLGYEWDEDADNGFRPAGLLRLSSTTHNVQSYVTDYGSGVTTADATHHLTLYRAPSGALVFGAGTLQWSFGLDGTHDFGGGPTDQRMKQATVNLFADMGVQPSTMESGLTPSTASTDTTAPTSTITSPTPNANLPAGEPVTITGTATDAGGGVVGGVEVSVDGGSTWHPATGRQNWSYTWSSGPTASTTIKSRAVDDSANLESPSAGVPITVGSPSCPCSIWTPSSTPQTPATDDTGGYELGVRFRSDVAGYVTGLRFYKGSGNTGTHVGHLWTATGTQLAAATFTNETATGWQQVNLSTPVAISANTTYVGSYWAPAGHFAVNRQAFATAGVDRPPLHALRDGQDGPNGVYSFGQGFPTSTFDSSNYWVDVVFERTLPGDTNPPAVTSVFPSSGATGVGTNTSVTAEFNEAVDPATVTTTSFELRDPGGGLVTATVSASGSTATLTPSAALAGSTTYTAKVKGGSGGVKDLSGNALAADHAWSFTTGVPDTTPPTVTSVVPAGGATGVSRNAPVTAQFSEAIAPASVTATSFELRGPGGALVTANVSASGSTASLAPSTALAYETTYTATLKGGSAGVKDQAGNPLPADHLWSFTTAAPAACPCSLWDASATPSTPATADTSALELGVRFQSDVSGFITGLRFYKGSGNTGTHVGHLWSAAGTQLAAATFTNETATGWQQVNLSTPVAISANTVYVASYYAPAGHYSLDRPYFGAAYDNPPLHAPAEGAGGGNGVYAFGGGFPTSSYQASNYWVDVVFERTLPGDTTPPTVSSVSPASGATGVGANANVTGLFSEALDPASVTTSTFELRAPGGAVVPAAVSASGATATLNPSAALTASTTYTATLKGGSAGVKDQAGNPLAADHSWSFTTAAPAACPCSLWDGSATPTTPATTDSSPFELGVRFQSDVTGYITGIRFYKGAGNTGTHVGHLWSATGTQLADATFTNETATGWQQVNFATPVAIAADTTYVASYFAPAGQYALDRPYFTTAYDNAPLHAPADGAGGGNGVYHAFGSGFPTSSYLSSNYWVDVVFERTLPGDTTPPTVSSVTPISGATGVGASVNVRAALSEALDPASATTSSFELRSPGGALVPATVSASGSTVTLDPSATLTASTTYTATLKGGAAGIKDQAGNPLAADHSWSFTTAAPAVCPCSLWSDAAVPTTAAVTDVDPYEVGVRFQSDVDGYVTGIRFYKGSGNTGTHVGHLWTATGTQLAAASFTNETATGWQQVSFASPVPVTANTTYVASYFAPAGHYALDRPYFTAGYDNAPLHAPADGPGGGNGVYHAFGSGFPTSSSQASNYWVDVVFDTSPADTTSPTSTTTFPASSASYNIAGWNAGCATPGFCGTAADLGSGLQKVELSIRQGAGNYWNGTAFASASEVFVPASGTSSWSYAFPTTRFPSDGQYTIRVRATDNAGNVEVPAARTFTYDSSVPSSSTSFPASSGVYDTAGWNAGCPTAGLCGTASDTGSGLQKVELSIRQGAGNYWNGSAFASASEIYVAATGISSWSYALATSAFAADGQYTIRVRATDNAGNVEAPAARTFTYDGNGPVVTTTFPGAAGNYNAVTWTPGCVPAGFCGTASDPGSGVQRVELSIRQGAGNYWDGSAFGSPSEVFVPATGTSSWNYAFPLTSFPADGQYTIRVRAADVIGNTANPTSRTFTFDTLLPASSMSFPAASAAYRSATWTAGCPTAGFCGAATDPTSGVQRVQLSIRRGTGNYWNGTSFGSGSEVWVTATGTTTWSYGFAATSFPAAGSYTVRARATDNAGNVEAPTSTTFTYDATAPTSTVTFPAASGNYNSAGWDAGCPTAGICGAASDAASGLTRVELSIRQLSPSRYWNGTSFASSTEVFHAASGTTAWNFAFAASSFPVNGQYTIRVRATDNAGNVQSPSSRTFRYDTVSPTATINFPVANGSYTTATWNNGCSSAICGSAADSGGSGVLGVEISVVQSATGSYWNGTAFASASEVFAAPTGVSPWGYAFPGTSFPAAGSYAVRARATDRAGNVGNPAPRPFTFTP